MSNEDRPISKKYILRIDKETGDPILVITNQVKLFCHKEVSEQTEDGDIVELKMRPTVQFLQKFNERVLDLLTECIQHARLEDRTELMPQDVVKEG